MVEIPQALRAVFSATVRERDGTYVLELPAREFEHDTLTVGDTYRIALLAATQATPVNESDAPSTGLSQRVSQRSPSEPPVAAGDRREVTIETVGEEGDGIAKVDHGYVVIVPGTQPGDQPTVEIERVTQTVAFATVVEEDPRAL